MPDAATVVGIDMTLNGISRYLQDQLTESSATHFIFDSLGQALKAPTASDRSYKTAKLVSTAMDILHKMVVDNHLDKNCFDLFVRSKVYLRYAERFLDPQ